MASPKTINVTEVSDLLVCSRDYYESAVNDPLSEFKLFVVKSPENKTVEVYYGQRKLKDILVVESLPSGLEYPSNKLYIRISQSGQVKDLFYKTPDSRLISLSEKMLVKEVTYDHNSVRILWNDNREFNLSVLSVDGEVTPLTISIAEKVKELADKLDPEVVWKSIS